MLHLIRCVCCATTNLKTCYRYCIRPTNTDTTSRTNLIYHTNLIRFTRSTIVEFNCRMVLDLISSQVNSTIVRRINRALDSSSRRLGAATSNLCSRRSFAKARELKATKLRVQQIRRRGKDACLLARYYRTPGT